MMEASKMPYHTHLHKYNSHFHQLCHMKYSDELAVVAQLSLPSGGREGGGAEEDRGVQGGGQEGSRGDQRRAG